MQRVYEFLLKDHFKGNRQMAFLSGPRQVGKTTLAQAALPKACVFNYDAPEGARALLAGAGRVAEVAGLDDPSNRSKGVVFDEIHKFAKWKLFLKGFFDVYGKGLPIAVTGSARLDIYKRGGDSLMGRYFPYRVHPLSIGEIGLRKEVQLDELVQSKVAVTEGELEHLLRFGGYPEPFLNGTMRFYNRWKNGRIEKIFDEDLRDLSRVQDIRGIQTLGTILGERVGSNVNYSSLAADLAVTGDTVKLWIGLLESVYFCFAVHPWSKHVANAIRKQPKLYLWDWSTIADEGARNENFLASHLLKNVQWWTDSGLGRFDLHYIRDKQQHEVDFLISRENEPFMLVEGKTSMKEPMSPMLGYFQKHLKVPYAFQVALTGARSGVDLMGYKGEAIKISAIDFLGQLI